MLIKEAQVKGSPLGSSPAGSPQGQKQTEKIRFLMSLKILPRRHCEVKGIRLVTNT